MSHKAIDQGALKALTAERRPVLLVTTRGDFSAQAPPECPHRRGGPKHGDTMGAMESPSLRIRVDAQGRMVLPRRLREDIVTTPGELVVRRVAEGLLLTSATTAGVVSTGTDGLPVLHLGRKVTNNEVLDALDRERVER